LVDPSTGQQVPQQQVYNPYAPQAPSYHAVPAGVPDQNAPAMHYMAQQQQAPGIPPPALPPHQQPIPVQTSQPYVPPVAYAAPGQYPPPPQQPYYAAPHHPSASVPPPPAAYYPGYAPQPYDPTKMAAVVDPSQTQVYAQ
jgi:hypothetical protein